MHRYQTAIEKIAKEETSKGYTSKKEYMQKAIANGVLGTLGTAGILAGAHKSFIGGKLPVGDILKPSLAVGALSASGPLIGNYMDRRGERIDAVVSKSPVSDEQKKALQEILGKNVTRGAIAGAALAPAAVLAKGLISSGKLDPKVLLPMAASVLPGATVGALAGGVKTFGDTAEYLESAQKKK